MFNSCRKEMRTMTSIGEVNNMANQMDFVKESAQIQNAFQAQNLNKTQTNKLEIPEPLPNAFGGMTGKETVFDIQMQALEGNSGSTESPDGMGDIVDILA